MAITRKQKKLIDEKKASLTSQQIASELDLDVKSVDVYISSKSKNNPKWFYLTLILIPILFLFIVEISLIVFNYGRDNDQWVSAGDGKLKLNPGIAYRYFYTTEEVPSAGYNIFDRIKNENTYRVFVMGGSSAAGFPFPANGSFASFFKHRFQNCFPDKNIEVVNIAMSAINSYSLLDMIPGVIDQQPDLIIIYAGHNEYYGALGVGSMETLGEARFIIKTVLWLNKFKTFELLRSIIKSISDIFSNPVKTDETLMARMSQDQQILFNSDEYNSGLIQFESNLKEIFADCQKAGINLLIGTIVSNLKDQSPFSSIEDEEYQSANEVYNLANDELILGNVKIADSLFRYAKDLDALRWRAPEQINKIILKLGNKFNYPVINLDSIFIESSPENITGDYLIMDHLHPNLKGYQIIGDAFFYEAAKSGFLPESNREFIDNAQQYSFDSKQFHFTKIDSTIAQYQVIILKSDWPYVKEKKSDVEKLRALNMQTFSDTLAFLVGKRDLSWEEAHIKLSHWFIKMGDKEAGKKEMNVIIGEYPENAYYYRLAANQLIDFKKFDDAYPYLTKLNELKKDAFSTKWLGVIELLKNNTEAAISFLSESLKYNSSDAQVLYNLAGAYTIINDYETALQLVKNCLIIDPNYNQAIDLRNQLVNAIYQK